MNLTKEAFEYFATSLWDKTNEKFVVQEEGKTLTSNDYTDEDKNKLNKVDILVGDADLETESKIVTGAINELKEQIKKSGNSDYGTITKEDLGLENVDNTSDVDKPVSTAQQEAIDNVFTESKSYTDTKVADLVGTAPETLNTLEEVAQAIEENEGVVEALNSAIGNKANQNDLKALQDVVDTKIGQDDLTGFMTSDNPTGTGSLSMNRKADTTIGNYSVALGIDATASGQNSHAEGYQTTASGNNSHSEGSQTTASGQNSHAEGNSSKAEARYAHAEGDATFATGEASHSEGYNATASGINSHAEGKKTTASKDNAHAEGAYTTASGINSHAEGDTTFATGTNSHAEGNVARANGLNSHAEGYYTTANGENQHVQGKFNAIDNNNTYAHIVGGGTSDAYADRKNIHTLDWEGNADFAGDVTATDSEGNKVSLVDLASNSSSGSGDYLAIENPVGTGSFSINRKADTTVGDYSVAMGYNNEASGYHSVAEGSETVASGSISHSEGLETTASGTYSHAEGCYTTASGAYGTHAEGAYTIASGQHSHAEGLNTIAQGLVQHVQGKYNVADTSDDYAHIVGGGKSDTDRKNIHTLDWYGNASFAGNVTATSSNGTAVRLIGHTHDDRYYTESEIDTKLNAKANSSHGNHVPAKETANNARFLRNDNTWQTITPANIGASAAHSHPYLPTAGGTVTGTLTASGGILISGASKLTNLLNLGDTLAPDKSRYYINGNATGRFNALRYVTTSKLSSARRYKENIEYTDIDYWHDRLMKVKPCTFTFINDEDKKFNVGVIAEDLEEYLPEFVDYNENGECESVYYTELIIPMLSEIQRLNSIIDTQQATINNLLEKFDELEQKIK